MQEKYRGIVLTAVSFGENDKILTIFTLEKGVISARIKGVKKAGAKLKFASEPFCFAEFLFSSGTLGGTPGRTVTGASLIDSFYPVREDIVKFFAGGTVLEFVKKFYRENISDPEFFLSMIEALKNIAYGSADAKAYLAEFLTAALEENGYALKTDGCPCENVEVNRAFFDYRRGAFFCEECFDGVGREITVTTYNAFIKIGRGERLDGDEGEKCIKLLDYYLEKKAEERLKSLKELIKICG